MPGACSWGQVAGRGSDESVLLRLLLDLVEGRVSVWLFALVQSQQLPAFGSCCSLSGGHSPSKSG